MASFKLLVVIHETVLPAEEILVLHQSDTFLASYHAVIKLVGDICYFVNPTAKAYAAAQSSFLYNNIKEEIDNSVDDFAYHIALETPKDGNSEEYKSTHSGYTNNQYQSLAWLVSRTGVRLDRITTHNDIDLTGKYKDPRSFDMEYFINLLGQYPNKRQIDFGFLNYL